MAGPEERQAKALETISGYLKQLIPVMETINKNLVDFAKLSIKNPTEPPEYHVPVEGYAAGIEQKKEGD